MTHFITTVKFCQWIHSHLRLLC